MYTVYIIFTFIIVISFITGNIVLYTEHKFNKGRKLVLKNDILIDEEVL